MRRHTSWLCLLIALAAPLASEAKVAYGLGLSLAEIGQNLYESAEEEADEAYDGRTLIAVAPHAPTEIDAVTALPQAFEFLTSGVLLSLLPAKSHLVRRRRGPWDWPPPTARKRQALLQTFLI